MRMAFLGACALLTAGCSGANVLYLHSESDATAMSGAVTAFDGARTKHAAFLSGEADFLAAAHQESRDQLIMSMMRVRDNNLVALIRSEKNGHARNAADTRNRMADFAGHRVKELIGDHAAALDWKAQFNQTAKEDRLLRVDTSVLRDSLQRHQGALKQFESEGGKIKASTKCAINSLPEKAGTYGAFLESLWTRAIGYCRDFQEYTCNAAGLSSFDMQISDDVRDSCQLGSGSDSEFTKKGEVGATTRELRQIEAAQAAQRKLFKEINKTLNASKAAYKCALEQKLPSERLEAGVVAVAETLARIVDELDTAPESERDSASADGNGGAEKPTASNADCTQKEVAETPEAIFSEAGFDDIEDFFTIVREANAVPQIAAETRALKAKITGDSAFNILKEIASHKPGQPVTADNETARVALSVIAAFGRFQDFFAAEKLPSANALAISLTADRLAADIAKIEASHLDARRDLLLTKRNALASELRYLADAYEAGTREKIIRRYANSWTFGRIQARAVDFELISLRQKSWLQRETAATLAAYDVVSPALEELKVYSEGGVKPELIAQILNLLGVSAIATGVN